LDVQALVYARFAENVLLDRAVDGQLLQTLGIVRGSRFPLGRRNHLNYVRKKKRQTLGSGVKGATLTMP